MMKIALFVISLFIVGPAFAGFDEGLAAYEKSDFATALKEWLPLAEQGDAKAQFNLGVMYANGQGVAQDHAQAVQWYRKAADQGDAKAQFNLGAMYAEGRGVAQDDAQAVQWFRKAADQGHADAQLILGAMYAEGRGVAQDDAQAVQWYRKAADQCHADALGELGWKYEHGSGVTRDLEKAVQLYAPCAKRGDENAKNELASLQEKQKCLKQASTQLFGEALSCTDKDALRLAAKQAGAKATREDNGYWYDTYDSSGLLEGTSELSIAYIKQKFAKAYYKYNSMMDAHKVVEVRDMVASKYGKPATSNGNPSLGPVSYTWKLKDGIQVKVSREWPDTTVYLTYTHPANFAAMEAEQARQKRAEEDEKRGKQSKAF